MRILRSWMIVLLVALATISMGQSWSSAYETGLKAARSGKWAEARTSFQQAAASRPEDQSSPTRLPGPPTEQRTWRNGAPYSPNFMAAYAEYRLALSIKDTEEQTAALKTAAAEFETLLAKKQNSQQSAYFLGDIYTRLNDTGKRMALQDRVAKAGKMDWRVDTEVVAPEDLAAMNAAVSGVAQNPNTTTNPGAGSTNLITVKAGDLTPGSSIPFNGLTTVPAVPNKYAIIIGQSETRLKDGKISFAADDAQRVRESLISFAGYAETNVDLVINATAAQIMASVKALAERIPEDATVTLFYSGPGVNIEGRDYLVGVDTELATDASSMVATADIYQAFIQKGSRLYAFFEATRASVGGRFFGQDIPRVGRISMMQGTMVDGGLDSYYQGGKQIGLFASAFATALEELRSNRLPIMEFGWQVFYKMKRGTTGGTGGGAHQTPTLPVLVNLAADARF